MQFYVFKESWYWNYHQHQLHWSYLATRLQLGFAQATAWPFPTLLLWLFHHHLCQINWTLLWILNRNVWKNIFSTHYYNESQNGLFQLNITETICFSNLVWQISYPYSIFLVADIIKLNLHVVTDKASIRLLSFHKVYYISFTTSENVYSRKLGKIIATGK